jgi:hypothetical protein
MKPEDGKDDGFKVKLTTDLRRYHKSLVPGVIGFTAGRWGLWSKNQYRFITVKFPEITLDILWEGLEPA